jgi:hypothetical protein
MDIRLTVEAYAMKYRAYHDALDIYIDHQDWESLHELDRARDHLADCVKRLHDMDIKVTLGVIEKEPERNCA